MVAEREFEGKVALVTGGSRRIGRAIALRFAAAGASVVINTRSNIEEAQKVAREAEAMGVAALPVLADVTDQRAVTRMIDAAVQRFGRLDFLVNNAVARAHIPFAEMTVEQWRAALSVTLDGAFLCAQACAPHLTRAKGALVNIGGISAHVGNQNLASVTAKLGVVGLTRSLALILAPDVTVNCVAPGRIDDPDYDRRAGPATGALDKIPAKRAGTPQEVAEAVTALCGQGMRFVTGQVLHVDGGVYFGA